MKNIPIILIILGLVIFNSWEYLELAFPWLSSIWEYGKTFIGYIGFAIATLMSVRFGYKRKLEVAEGYVDRLSFLLKKILFLQEQYFLLTPRLKEILESDDMGEIVSWARGVKEVDDDANYDMPPCGGRSSDDGRLYWICSIELGKLLCRCYFVIHELSLCVPSFKKEIGFLDMEFCNFSDIPEGLRVQILAELRGLWCDSSVG